MSTSLMPLDPAMSPSQTARLLPIRAKLLPAEITSRRNARRMRTFVIAGVLLALVGLGGWSADAYHDRSVAEDDLTAVNTQTSQVNATMNDAKHSKVTKTIAENKAISEELTTLMADDLRWSALVDNLRATAAASEVTIGQITAALATATNGSGTTTGGGTPPAGSTAPVATLSLQGSAKDKSIIAAFIKKLAVMPGIGNPYLTTATQSTTGSAGSDRYSFTINADVTPVALCGRFTKACPSGGK
jgi:hypothetical protein